MLLDGTTVCIRPVRPTDEARMREGIEQLSDQSRYLRFFSGQPMPSDPVLTRLLDVDGQRHIAWGAIITGSTDSPAIGAVHVFRDTTDRQSGEFSVAIVDGYQGQGLARILTAILLVNCHLAGILTLDVQTLAENVPAQRLVTSLGGRRRRSAGGVVDYSMNVARALAELRNEDHPGLLRVFAQLQRYLV